MKVGHPPLPPYSAPSPRQRPDHAPWPGQNEGVEAAAPGAVPAEKVYQGEWLGQERRSGGDYAELLRQARLRSSPAGRAADPGPDQPPAQVRRALAAYRDNGTEEVDLMPRVDDFV